LAGDFNDLALHRAGLPDCVCSGRRNGREGVSWSYYSAANKCFLGGGDPSGGSLSVQVRVSVKYFRLSRSLDSCDINVAYKSLNHG